MQIQILHLLPVCQRGDDQTVSATEELILINEVYISNGHDDFVQLLLIVEPALFQPFKITQRLDTFFHLRTKNINMRVLHI